MGPGAGREDKSLQSHPESQASEPTKAGVACPLPTWGSSLFITFQDPVYQFCTASRGVWQCPVHEPSGKGCLEKRIMVGFFL